MGEMFGFLEKDLIDQPAVAKEVDARPGSWGRFYARIVKFREAGRRFPVLQHHCWWLIHNCVAHMLIGLLPHSKTFSFHDWTSKKLNAL